MDIGLLLFIAQAITFAGFCGYLARVKNLNEVAGTFLGLIFSIIALITVAGAPVREKESRKPVVG